MAELDGLWQRACGEWAAGSGAKSRLWRPLFDAARATDGEGGDWRAVRAPGRVNLIGEHTDYNGLPVMPMAVEREIAVLFRPLETPEVRIASPDAAYGEREFNVSAAIEPYGKGDWGNYAKASVQALVEHAPHAAGRGFQAFVSGDIPAGAGLSSSSALVVAMALAFASANGMHVPAREMADLMATGEHYVGTQGGGMDQTACLMARAGHALMIEFNPTRPRPIPLPDGVSVIIANSLVRAEKSGGARADYNLRPAECRMAVALLNRATGESLAALSDLFGRPEAPLDAVDGHIRPEPYTARELAAKLGLSMGDFQHAFLRQRDGSLLEQPPEGFQPHRRARHVVTEAQRVFDAAEAMQRGDAAGLGALMDASHASCAEVYQISCAELDEMVRIARSAGALGARLTGAGFGGCVVALARTCETEQVISALQREYYEGWLPAHRSGLTAGPMEERVFSTRACEGAQVLE